MLRTWIVVTGAALCSVALSGAQSPTTRVPAPAEIKRIGPNLVQIGTIRVDTKLRELRAPGRLNQVTVLEFIANTPAGLKYYESAITVDATAATFNAALLLLGLDPARSRVPTHHFDPVAPAGDPIELSFEADVLGVSKRWPVEHLMWNYALNSTVPVGPWVYTGSSFSQGQFLAEADGVLIGMVRSPAPLIENPRKIGDNYGAIVLNPNLGLAPLTRVTLIVKALDRPTSR
jgi:hypothetical protein